MKAPTAINTKNRIDRPFNIERAEPVRVQRQGRHVAVVLSPDEFHRLSASAAGKVSPAVQKIHAESGKRWAKVYVALAG